MSDNYQSNGAEPAVCVPATESVEHKVIKDVCGTLHDFMAFSMVFHYDFVRRVLRHLGLMLMSPAAVRLEINNSLTCVIMALVHAGRFTLEVVVQLNRLTAVGIDLHLNLRDATDGLTLLNRLVLDCVTAKRNHNEEVFECGCRAVEWLLTVPSVDVNKNHEPAGCTPLMDAVPVPQLLRLLLPRKPQLNVRGGQHNTTALEHAVAHCEEASVRILLEHAWERGLLSVMSRSGGELHQALARATRMDAVRSTHGAPKREAIKAVLREAIRQGSGRTAPGRA